MEIITPNLIPFYFYPPPFTYLSEYFQVSIFAKMNSFLRWYFLLRFFIPVVFKK